MELLAPKINTQSLKPKLQGPSYPGPHLPKINSESNELKSGKLIVREFTNNDQMIFLSNGGFFDDDYGTPRSSSAKAEPFNFGKFVDERHQIYQQWWHLAGLPAHPARRAV